MLTRENAGRAGLAVAVGLWVLVLICDATKLFAAYPTYVESSPRGEPPPGPIMCRAIDPTPYIGNTYTDEVVYFPSGACIGGDKFIRSEALGDQAGWALFDHDYFDGHNSKFYWITVYANSVTISMIKHHANYVVAIPGYGRGAVQ